MVSRETKLPNSYTVGGSVYSNTFVLDNYKIRKTFWIQNHLRTLFHIIPNLANLFWSDSVERSENAIFHQVGLIRRTYFLSLSLFVWTATAAPRDTTEDGNQEK